MNFALKSLNKAKKKQKEKASKVQGKIKKIINKP